LAFSGYLLKKRKNKKKTSFLALVLPNLNRPG